MGSLPDIGFPQTGDEAESGTYACMNCPHEITDDKSVAILDKRKKLPKCPVCGNTYWLKL